MFDEFKFSKKTLEIIYGNLVIRLIDDNKLPGFSFQKLKNGQERFRYRERGDAPGVWVSKDRVYDIALPLIKEAEQILLDTPYKNL